MLTFLFLQFDFSLFFLVGRCSVASTQMRIYIHIVSNKRNKNNTCEMHPPRPKPSKNWWKVNAATRGLIVFGLSEAPREMPIIMECTTIPNSKTYTQNFVQTFLCFKEVLYIFLNKVINTREKKNSYIGFWNWLKIILLKKHRKQRSDKTDSRNQSKHKTHGIFFTKRIEINYILKFISN